MKLIRNAQYVHFIFLSLILLGIVGRVNGQTENLLNIKIATVEIDALDFSVALPEIAKIYGVSIGFENAKVDESGKQVIRLKNATLKEVLDFVVTKSNPEYEWSVVNDVINVFPRENRDCVLENLLNVKINKFSVEKNASNLEIRTKLSNLPEVKSVMLKNNLKPLNLAFFSGEMAKSNQSELSFDGIGLRELLNKIIKERGKNFWVVTRYGKQREFLIIDF